jgi:hypothetical protein
MVRALYGQVLARRHGPQYRVGATMGRIVVPRLPERLRLDPIAALAIRHAARRKQVPSAALYS